MKIVVEVVFLKLYKWGVSVLCYKFVIMFLFGWINKFFFIYYYDVLK